MLALLAGACDRGDPDVDRADTPELKVVSVWPENGAGTECEPSGPAGCGVPRDTTVEIRFDRHLKPTTAVRQSVRLYTGSTDNGVFLEPTYDVIERVVVYEVGRNLLPGTLYTVELVVPGPGEPNGFRSFDGAPLSRRSAGPLTWSFRTRLEEPEDPVGRPAAPTCSDVLTGPFGLCAYCHRRAPEEPEAGCGPGEVTIGDECVAVPRQGLRLDTREGLLETAVGHVAHQTEIGPVGGQPLSNPSRLGVQMPIIDPGKPANSYLMYKLIRNVANYSDEEGDECSTVHHAALAGHCLPPSEGELRRLREWFVRLDPMPPPRDELAISRSEFRLIQSWIRTLGTPGSPAWCW